MTRNLLLKFSIIHAFIGLSTCLVFADTITLKDGRIFKGKVINENNETVSIEIPFANGKLVRKINKPDISLIETSQAVSKTSIPVSGSSLSDTTVDASHTKGNITLSDTRVETAKEVIANPSIFGNKVIGFEIKLYPEYKKMPDMEKWYFRGKSDFIRIDLVKCTGDQKLAQRKLFQTNQHPLAQYYESRKIIEKDTLFFNNFEIFFWKIVHGTTIVWSYVLFPNSKHNYYVLLDFNYPKEKDIMRQQEIQNMVATINCF